MRVCGGWKKRPSERPEGTASMGRPVGLIAPVLLSLQLAGCPTSAVDIGPARPDAPWTAVTAPNGEIIAGERVPPGLPRNPSYVLPPNQALANPPLPALELERRHPYSLPELIDIAQSSNPVTRNAWNDARNAALVAGIAESTFLPLVSAGIVQGWQRFHNEFTPLRA